MTAQPLTGTATASRTIYLTLAPGPFWSIRPARILVLARGWALAVWEYALIWFLLTDRARLAAYPILSTATALPGTPATKAASAPPWRQ